MAAYVRTMPFLALFTSGPNGGGDTEALREYAQLQGYHHRTAIERLCDEIDRLHLGVDYTDEGSEIVLRQLADVRRELVAARAALDRVRARHVETNPGPDRDGHSWCGEDGLDWPCPTVEHLADPPADVEDGRSPRECPECRGTGWISQAIDRRGRRYINQPVEDREHRCDQCDGTGREAWTLADADAYEREDVSLRWRANAEDGAL